MKALAAFQCIEKSEQKAYGNQNAIPGKRMTVNVKCSWIDSNIDTNTWELDMIHIHADTTSLTKFLCRKFTDPD